MTKLEKGMFGYPTQSRLFGLCEGAIKSADFIHNGGWYNKKGEKLGWGDLSLNDLDRISKEIEEGEFFIILFESDSFWKHVDKIYGAACLGMVTVDREAEMDPGLEHVLGTACYAITKGKILSIPGKYSFDNAPGPITLRDHRSGSSLEAERITRDTLKELLLP